MAVVVVVVRFCRCVKCFTFYQLCKWRGTRRLFSFFLMDVRLVDLHEPKKHVKRRETNSPAAISRTRVSSLRLPGADFPPLFPPFVFSSPPHGDDMIWVSYIPSYMNVVDRMRCQSGFLLFIYRLLLLCAPAPCSFCSSGGPHISRM